MAMAPSVWIGGRIAASFLCSGSRSIGAVIAATKCVVATSSGSRGQFLITRAKGSAAEWLESADAYFGTKDSIATADNPPVEQEDLPTHSKRSARRLPRKSEERNAARSLRDYEMDDAENGNENAGDGSRARKRDFAGPRNLVEESVPDEESDEQFEEPEEDREARRALPLGMRRLRRGYLRNDPKRFYDPREVDEKPSEVPALQGEPLYGVGPVRAALQSRRRDLYVLYVQHGLDEKHPGKRKALADVVWILKTAKRLELRIESASKHILNMLVNSRPHQGMVLDASPLEMVDISALDPPDPMLARAPVWLALDEVKDPQNFGAILRSSHFFGVTGVVVCAKNSAPPNGVVSKASAGALEMMDLLSCRSMMMFLRDSAENGWRVLGTSNNAESEVLGDLPKNVPTILVLGNEGVGIRPFVKAACTHMVRIPGALPLRRSRTKKVEEAASLAESSSAGDELATSPEGALKATVRYEMLKLNAEVYCALRPGIVDSLNVSVAAGVLLNDLMNFSSKSSSKSSS